MLDSAGNADGNVELRRHHFSGLADLQVVGNVTGVDGGAGSSNGGAQFVRQLGLTKGKLRARHKTQTDIQPISTRLSAFLSFPFLSSPFPPLPSFLICVTQQQRKDFDISEYSPRTKA